MVDVISTEPDHRVAKITPCENCGATLQYVPNDIVTEKYGHDYLGGYETRKAVKCPNCGKMTGV